MIATAALRAKPAARPAGFVHDLLAVAGRQLRAIRREPDTFAWSLIPPPFFFFVNIGALENAATFVGVTDYKAFQLPVAILFAITGVSRAVALVTDIQSGYFKRLLAAPVSRAALLLGLMTADLIVVLSLSVLVLLMGTLVGVRFATGPIGIASFLLLSALWGLAFTGFPYAVALRTGSLAAVNSVFLMFFPLLFVTTAFLPKHALSGWMATAVDFNPVTYVLAGLRALISVGWTADAVAALAAIAVVSAISFSLALLALRGRISRG